MIHRRLLLLLLSVGFCTGYVFAQANWNTSLHKNRQGKDYWYGTANGGFEQFTNVPMDSLGCVECHGPTDANGDAYPADYTPGCSDCHPDGTGFNPDSIQVSQCYSCHGRQATEASKLGYSDVHRDRGMKCWDCHTNNDMHGGPTAVNSMLDPEGIEVDCEDCHTTAGGTLPDHPSYDPAAHGGKIHCTSCHGQTVLSCYNCHFESQVDSHVKRAKQPLHDFVILANRDKDNKVYPMTFQSLTYQGSAFAAFGPFTSHTIDSTGRTCSDCHNNMGSQNAAINEYNSTSFIYFAKWNDADSTLSWMKGIVPMPADYQRSWKMDFITYNGNTSDPAGPSKNWSKIGKNTWDGHQMLFATPLTKVQMAKLGFDTTLVTSVEADPAATLPDEYALSQNYPNPFNPSTRISFKLPASTEVTLKVYNLLGEEVMTEIDGQLMGAGSYTVTVDAASLASGVYLYKLITPGFTQARKMVLLK
ncbi:MAG: T9SS type A sorting domain-containing protein [Bacteroidetes bacterium]|nr:T9SS type A sorting domain-containing protein [Bacteroidota bacterium]